MSGPGRAPSQPRAEPEAEPAPASAPRSASAPAAPAVPASALALARAPLAVRLTLPAGAHSVEIASPWLGRVVLEGRPHAVRTPRGALLEELWLDAPPGAREAAAPGSGWSLGDRVYPGRLRVRADASGALEVLNLVPLEEYVAGVVAAELPLWSAEPAELEAQAIAARSYALRVLEARARAGAEALLADDVRDQAYLGLPPAPGASGPAAAAALRLEAALERSRGRVLVDASGLLDARFHASCGGHTAAIGAVFAEGGAPAGEGVPCAPCRERPSTWSWTAAPDDLARLARELGLGARVERLGAVRRDAAGRWLEVEVHGPAGRRAVPFEQLRRLLGRERVKSGAIDRVWPPQGEPIAAGLLLGGRGRGHGTGMCQEGARGYARRGWSAERILAHYYPGARLASLR